MKHLLSWRNVAIASLTVVAFSLYQATLHMSSWSVKEDAHAYLRRFVPLETERSREVGFYSNGKDRLTISRPDLEFEKMLDEDCKLYKIDFSWNENPYVPPDAKTNAADVWVGRCSFTPTTNWWHLNVFGVVSQTDFNLYGDWHIESTPPWRR